MPPTRRTHFPMKSSPLFIAALCAAGLLVGAAARRISPPSATPADNHAAGPVGRSVVSENLSSAIVLPTAARSADIVESILQADPKSEYARIAAWLANAGAEEIAAYWASYRGGARDKPVTELIFIQWTRRDPNTATAAVTGTEDEGTAWWAWSASDPAAALAAARTPLQKRQAVRGIGEFQPDWLRAHFQEIPEEFRESALAAMVERTAGQAPRETLDFLRQNGMNGAGNLFDRWVEQDPWAALDWLKETAATSNDPFANQPNLDRWISTIARERPEDLERLAAQSPPGADKRAMDTALFDLLLKTDPAAAREKARATEAPLVAAQMLGKLGLETLATDPDKAFAIAAEIVAANPTKIGIDRLISYPGGGGGRNFVVPASHLLNELYGRDRERTVGLVAAELTEGRSEVFGNLAEKWAGDDLAGFSEWAGRQSGVVLQSSATQIGFKLAQQGRYPEAIQWADVNGLDPDRAYNIVLIPWNRADPQAAAAWLESSNLTEPQKASYRQILNKSRR
jgi:hypothetical protein